MPRKVRRNISVRIGEHAEKRWLERAGRPAGKLARLLRAKLIEQTRLGLTVTHGRALVTLNADDLGLPQDIIACLELPDVRGVWQVVTFFTPTWGQKQSRFARAAKIKPQCNFNTLLKDGKDMSERIDYIKIDSIEPNPDNPRKNFDQEALEQLSQSIRENVKYPRYLDKKGRELFVSKGLGDEFGIFWKSPTGGLHRVKSPAMPMVTTAKEAQAHLDNYAKAKGLKPVTNTN